MLRRAPSLILLLAASASGCHTPDDRGPNSAAPASASAPAPTALATATAAFTSSAAASTAGPLRPYLLHGGSGDEPRPLVLFLHGYGASALGVSRLLDLPALARAKGIALVVPDGTKDSRGMRAWNATDACCDFDHRNVDDVGALRDVIAAVKGRTKIAAGRLFVVGFSNGGFMAHRLACELPEIAGIASLSGVGYLDTSRCRPTQPMKLLHVHGDRDEAVPYGGGHVLGRATVPRHPSAADTVAFWARHNHCKGNHELKLVLGDKQPIDAVRYEGCSAPVELWTAPGGGHAVGINRASVRQVIEHLLAK